MSVRMTDATSEPTRVRSAWDAIRYGCNALGALSFLTLLYFLLTAGLDVSAQRLDTFIMPWPTTQSATRPLGKNILATTTDTLGSVRATARDTGSVFNMRRVQSFLVRLNDPSGSRTDSANVTIELWGAIYHQFRYSQATLKWVDYAVIASTTVTKDDSTIVWNITNSPIPPCQLAVPIVKGNAANKKTADVTVKIMPAGDNE